MRRLTKTGPPSKPPHVARTSIRAAVEKALGRSSQPAVLENHTVAACPARSDARTLTYHARICWAARCESGVRISKQGDVGALMIRIRFGGILYQKYSEEPPKTLFQLLRSLH